MFTAVIAEVEKNVIDLLPAKFGPENGDMHSCKQVKWIRLANPAWMLVQVREGLLAAVERRHRGELAVARVKVVAVEHASSCLTFGSRVAGGDHLSQGAPDGQWAQDLRTERLPSPPWCLAYYQQSAPSWAG